MESALWQEAAKSVDVELQSELQNIAKYKCGTDGLLTLVNQKRDECRAHQWTCKNLKGQSTSFRLIEV